METKATKDAQNGQMAGQRVEEIANLSAEEKTVLLEKTLAELKQKNRDLQIEAALDRVRTRAMAMQRSEELKDLIALVSAELALLDVVFDRCFIEIFDPVTKGTTWWMSHPETPTEPIGLFTNYHEHPPYLAKLAAWENRQRRWQYTLEGEVKKAWDKFLFAETELSQLPPLVVNNMRALEKVYLSASFNNFGCLSIATLEQLSDEHFDILLRFATVFDLTYTRFNDLQLAEAQAREAKIEAALEKVRSRSLAMQKSEELGEVIAVVFQKLIELEFALENGAAIILIFSEGSKDHVQWVADKDHDYPMAFKIPYSDDAMVADIFREKERGTDFFSKIYPFEEKNNYFKFLFERTELKQVPEDVKMMLLTIEDYGFSIAFKKNSAILITTNTGKLISEDEKRIVKRFAKVFEQAYIRFLDLQKAEAQAREAKIEAALESVRASSMAMHHSEELDHVVKTLAEKLVDLGISLDGALIFFFDKAERSFHLWIATNQLPALLKVNMPYEEDMQANQIIKDLWEAIETGGDFINKCYSGKVKDDYFRFVGKHNMSIIPEEVRELDLEAESWTFSFTGGKNSVVGIDSWSGKVITPDEFRVLKRFANVFEQAYTRFLDLQKAEAQAIRAEQDLIEIKAARKKAEDTLAALKAAQAQLIQSEKMASLGELAAGIAHEIQNPLNFVNNFSDVSGEMMGELQQELTAGHTDEALALSNEIHQNLDKITHHGKRADAIVKSMLEHSRISKGEKQSTDINSLADEYLRLSYHGFRAKDQSFNAVLETHYDTTAEKINIIPQDIGRVLLNLFNNAFYSVQEKKKRMPEGYEPRVSVSMKQTGTQFEIRVRDNGLGISQKVLDKIFQPFFTTKPTGEGTGLGLSLSYDIVKAHGGEIKVESKEGEGTEFTIKLIDS